MKTEIHVTEFTKLSGYGDFTIDTESNVNPVLMNALQKIVITTIVERIIPMIDNHTKKQCLFAKFQNDFDSKSYLGALITVN